MSNKPSFRLSTEIVYRSVADNWDEAKKEWELEEIYDSKYPKQCLCGHFPIKEICVIRNKLNSNKAEVGNCCVNKFIPSTKRIFDSYKRVQRDITKAFNNDLINLVYEKGIINDWEYDFYIDTWRKRKLTYKQMKKRVSINKKILGRLNDRSIL